MDKKTTILLVIIAFLLGMLPYIGDQAYSFGGGKIVGIVDCVLRIFPSLNNVWFLGAVYYISRLAIFAAFGYLLYLFISSRKSKKGADSLEEVKEVKREGVYEAHCSANKTYRTIGIVIASIAGVALIYKTLRGKDAAK